jgi:hypothetical protein
MNDTSMLYEQYGDKIIFGIGSGITMDATPEVMEATAKAFVDKYAPNFATKPVLMSGFGAPAGFSQLVYRYSREALAAL